MIAYDFDIVHIYVKTAEMIFYFEIKLLIVIMF